MTLIDSKLLCRTKDWQVLTGSKCSLPAVDHYQTQQTPMPQLPFAYPFPQVQAYCCLFKGPERFLSQNFTCRAAAIRERTAAEHTGKLHVLNTFHFLHFSCLKLLVQLQRDSKSLILERKVFLCCAYEWLHF